MICVDEIGEYEWEDCPSCRGAGIDPNPLSWHGCLGCGGSGEVRVYLRDEDDEDHVVLAGD